MTLPRHPIRRILSSVRTRFTLAYAVLLAATGAALVALFFTYISVAGFVRVGTRATAPDRSAPVLPPSPEPAPADPVVANIGFMSVAIAVVFIAMWAGWLIAGRLLRPLDAIHHAAQGISRGELSTRVGLTRPDDEFADLARVFNQMLDRIQHSLETHRRFAANASHELRTPLATNKAMLAVALDRPEDTDFISLAQRLHEMNQHSIDTVEALLDLAEADHSIPGRECVDLADLAREQIVALQDEAEDAGIVILDRLQPAPVLGNRVLLIRLLANLLQNSVRHNVPLGTVMAHSSVEHGKARVIITNTGPTIPDALLATLTEPFVRRAGRTASTSPGGAGLGLAIVSAIAQAHGTRIDLSAEPHGGLTAWFSLPAAQPGGMS